MPKVASLKDSPKIKISLFFLGFMNFLSTRFFATLIYVELLAVIALFLVILGPPKIDQKRLDPKLRPLFFLGAGWGVQQAIVDLLRATAPRDAIASFAQVFVLCSLLYFALTWFQKDAIRIKYFLLGIVFSSIPSYFLEPSIYSKSDPWKFAFGPNVSLLFFLWISSKHFSSRKKILLITLLSGLDIVLGSRSLGLVTFLVVPFVLIRKSGRKKVSSLILIALLVSSFGFIAEKAYKDLSLSGVLGVNQELKAQNQINSGPLLLEARKEFLYEIASIRNNWFVGYGSHPNLEIGIATEVYRYESMLGFNTGTYADIKSSGKIPQHSILFSAWLEGGILGLAFWLYLIYLLFKWQGRVNPIEGPFGSLSTYLFLNFCWAALFSPLGAGTRMIIAYTVAVIFFQSAEDTSKVDT